MYSNKCGWLNPFFAWGWGIRRDNLLIIPYRPLWSHGFLELGHPVLTVRSCVQLLSQARTNIICTGVINGSTCSWQMITSFIMKRLQIQIPLGPYGAISLIIFWDLRPRPDRRTPLSTDSILPSPVGMTSESLAWKPTSLSGWSISDTCFMSFQLNRALPSWGPPYSLPLSLLVLPPSSKSSKSSQTASIWSRMPVGMMGSGMDAVLVDLDPTVALPGRGRIVSEACKGFFAFQAAFSPSICSLCSRSCSTVSEMTTIAAVSFRWSDVFAIFSLPTSCRYCRWDSSSNTLWEIVCWRPSERLVKIDWTFWEPGVLRVTTEKAVLVAQLTACGLWRAWEGLWITASESFCRFFHSPARTRWGVNGIIPTASHAPRILVSVKVNRWAGIKILIRIWFLVSAIWTLTKNKAKFIVAPAPPLPNTIYFSNQPLSTHCYMKKQATISIVATIHPSKPLESLLFRLRCLVRKGFGWPNSIHVVNMQNEGRCKHTVEILLYLPPCSLYGWIRPNHCRSCAVVGRLDLHQRAAANVWSVQGGRRAQFRYLDTSQRTPSWNGRYGHQVSITDTHSQLYIMKLEANSDSEI